jgi:hypothetical protein
MIRLMFLLPIVLCLLWFFFLKQNNLSVKQGKKGFLYILGFSGFILGFFTLMIFVTNQ